MGRPSGLRKEERGKRKGMKVGERERGCPVGARVPQSTHLSAALTAKVIVIPHFRVRLSLLSNASIAGTSLSIHTIFPSAAQIALAAARRCECYLLLGTM